MSQKSHFSQLAVNRVVSYDFKEERFAHLHRSAIGFPEGRFFYAGTSALSNAKAAALKGEALVRAQFQNDPFGCQSSLYYKKLKRDPFHRSIPYPNGCPEIESLTVDQLLFLAHSLGQIKQLKTNTSKITDT